MCIAYNSFINLFFSGVADKPRKKWQYIYIYFEAQLCVCMLDWFCHTLDYSKSGLAFLWKFAPIVTKSTVCFVRLISLVFIGCPLNWLVYMASSSSSNMFSMLSALYTVACKTLIFSLHSTFCFNCVYLKSWMKMLINCDTLWEIKFLVNHMLICIKDGWWFQLLGQKWGRCCAFVP